MEDLLEQEKREQEKRQHVDSSVSNNVPSTGSSLPALMSDADFELLRADVMNSSTSGTAIASPPIIQSNQFFFYTAYILRYYMQCVLMIMNEISTK